MGQREEKAFPGREETGRGEGGHKIILNSQTLYSFHLLPRNVLQLPKKTHTRKQHQQFKINKDFCMYVLENPDISKPL